MKSHLWGTKAKKPVLSHINLSIPSAPFCTQRNDHAQKGPQQLTTYTARTKLQDTFPARPRTVNTLLRQRPNIDVRISAFSVRPHPSLLRPTQVNHDGLQRGDTAQHTVHLGPLKGRYGGIRVEAQDELLQRTGRQRPAEQEHVRAEAALAGVVAPRGDWRELQGEGQCSQVAAVG